MTPNTAINTHLQENDMGSSWMASLGRALFIVALGVVCVVGSLATSPAHAQQPSADALVEQGIARREAGDDQGALALFQQAYATSPSARATAQLGLCEQALGQWVEASSHLQAALAATDDRWIRRNRRSLEEAFRAVSEQVGTLEIVGGVPGAVVRLGGRTVGTLPMSGPVTVIVGRGALEVVADGFLPFTAEIAVRGGELTRQTIELEPVPAQRAVASPGEAARASADSEIGDPGADSSIDSRATREDEGGSVLGEWWFWTLVGVAIAGGVVATVLIAGSGGLEEPIVGTAGVATALTF